VRRIPGETLPAEFNNQLDLPDITFPVLSHFPLLEFSHAGFDKPFFLNIAKLIGRGSGFSGKVSYPHYFM